MVKRCFNFPWQFSRHSETSLVILNPVPSCPVCITEILVSTISEQVPFLTMKMDTALCGSREVFSHPPRVSGAIQNRRNCVHSLYTDCKLRSFVPNSLDIALQLHYLAWQKILLIPTNLPSLQTCRDLHLWITWTYRMHFVWGREKLCMALQICLPLTSVMQSFPIIRNA